MSLSDDIAAITGTTQQYRWNLGAPLGTPVFVTFSFPTAPAAYDTGPGFAGLGALHQTYARMALDTWAASSGIRFLEVPEAAGGQIRFSFTDFSAYPGYAGFAYYPSSGSVTYNGVKTETWPSLSITGDIFLNPALYLADPTSLAPGRDGYTVLLHEIGHALGFKHPFEGNPVIEPAHDNDDYTVLSYNGRSTTTSLGSVDLAAVQLYYGSRPFDYSWDAGGRSLTVTGTGGDDVIRGTELNDRLIGGSGADRLNGGPGNDVIDGGAGRDWADQAGTIASRQVTKLGDGSVRVTNASTGEADTLVNVERLKFYDGIIAFDFEGRASPDTTAGVAFRLYQAAFDREPDVQGLSFWTKWLDDGKTDPWNMAARFIDSREFEVLYGSRTPENRDFVTRVYQNVLDRQPEPEGFNFWLTQLSNHTYTQSEVLARFSDSDENRANVADAISKGITLSNEYFLF